MAQEDELALASALIEARTTTPDDEAQVRSLARALRAPVSAVRATPPAERPQPSVADISREILTGAPATGRFLSNPDNARIAQDDVRPMSEMERILARSPMAGQRLQAGRQPANTPLNWLRGIGSAFGDAFSPRGSVAEGAQTALFDLLRNSPFGQPDATGSSIFNDAARQGQLRDVRRAQATQEAVRPDIQGNVSSGIYGGLTSLTRSSPGLIASLLTANPAPALALAGAQTSGEAYGRYAERGATPGQAALGAAGEGAVEVATELLPMGFLVDAFGAAGGKRFLVDTAKSLLLDVPGEQLATLAQDAIDTAIANPDKTWADYAAERRDAAIQTLVATLTQGALTTGAVALGRTASRRMTEAQAVETDANGIAAMEATAAGSALRERSPETFEAFVADLSRDGPVENLYVDANAFAQALGEEGVAAAVEAAPAIGEQLADALANGGDIQIPVEQFAARLAGTDLAAPLLDHLRANPILPSRAEVQALAQGDTENLVAEAQAVITAEQTDQAFQASAERVQESLLGQLNTAGRFSRDVNTAYASLITNFYAVQGARWGLSPEQMAERYPLRVTSEAPGTRPGEATMDQSVGGTEGFLRDVDVGALSGRLPTAYHRAMNRLTADGDYLMVDLPLQGLIGTQDEVNDDFETSSARYDPSVGEDRPAVFKVNGKYYVRDGHHRLAAASARGESAAPVRLFDVDGAMGLAEPVDPSTPLLDFSYPLRVTSEAPGTRPGEATMGQSDNVRLVHYSTQPGLLISDPSKWGANSAATSRDERNRVADAPGRTYFYDPAVRADPEGVIANTAPFAYEAEVPRARLYDFDADPQGLRPEGERNAANGSAYEAAIQRAGFLGYFSNATLNGAVALFEPTALRASGPVRTAEDAERVAKRVSELSRQWSVDMVKGLVPMGSPRPDFRAVALQEVAAEAEAPPAEAADPQPDTSRYEPLEGAPKSVKVGDRRIQFGPHAPARDAAYDYMAARGLRYEPPRQYAKVDTERATRVANAFDEMAHQPDDPVVRAAYRAMIDETLAQYQAIKATGLDIEFIDLERTGDPYALSPRLAILDVVENNHLWVFPTDDGFGGTESADVDITGNPLLELTNEWIGDRQLRANDVFRIVHDYFGHIKDGFGFRADGEENAWQSHASMFTPLARRAMTTETRGQNSWVNYGPFGEFNKTASAGETQYAPQKIGLLPLWVSEEGFLGGAETGTDGSGSTFYQSEPVGTAEDRRAEEKARKLADEIPGLKAALPFMSADEKAKLRKDTAAKISAMIEAFPSAEEMAAVAYSGRAKRGWYENSAQAILEIFGAQDAPRFAALLAALSPQTSVENNLFNALATWTNWINAGRPQDRASILEIMGRSVQGKGTIESVLNSWINNSLTALTTENPADITLSGPKVNSFMLNLIGVVDEVTNDAWMANYALVDQTLFKKTGAIPGKGPGYIAMNAVVRRAAEIATEKTGQPWTPAEVQETVWSWAKTLYELRDSAGENRTAQEILAAGDLRAEDIAATPDFALLFTNGVYRRILEAGGYGEQLEGLEAGGQFAYGDGERGDPRSSEGADFSQRDFQDLLQQAAGRLEELRTARRASEPRTLEQRNRGQIAFTADITQTPSVISLLQTADLSTFLHETGHFFLEVQAHMARQADAPAEVTADMQTTLDWFRPGLSLAEWDALTLEEKRPFHEQFARGFEAYLLEGNAPSSDLRALFQRFRSWLLNVYRSLSALNVTLTDEVRSVMGRMLASAEAVKETEDARHLKPLFETKPDYMTDAAWEEYQRSLAAATEDGLDTLQTRTARDMQWLSNAKSRALKKLQQANNEARKAVRAEVTAEVMAEPVNRVRRFLTRGIGDDGEAVEGAGKLDLEALRKMYGDGEAAMWRRLRVGGKFGEAGNDGLDPDAVAEMFGFESGDQMVRTMVESEQAQDKIASETDRRMFERYGDVNDERSLERAANQAVANDARARFVATEMAALAQMTGQPRALAETARTVAAGIVNRLEIKRLRPAQFFAAQARAARAAERALAKDDLQTAATQKRNQLVNLQAARYVLAAQDEVEKSLRLFNRIINAKDEALARTRDMNLVNAARAILAAYGVGRVKNDPISYLEMLSRYDPVLYADLKPWIDGARVDAKPIDQLSFERFQGLRDTVNQLWTLSRRTRQMEVDGQLQDMERLREALGERLDEIGLPVDPPGPRRAPTDTEKFQRQLQGARASLRRVESWARGLDGADTGPFRRIIWNPVSEGADRYRTAQREYLQRFLDLMRPIEASLTPAKIAAPEIGYTFSGRAELLHAILHTGNSSNLSKLLLGRSWGRKNADGSLDTSRWDALRDRLIAEGVLTKADYDFAQSVWDLLDETKPGAQAAHRAMYGRYFDEVAADPVDTPWGQYRGGYVPALTDAFLVQDAVLRAEQEAIEAGGAAMFPAASNGFTKSREEDYTRELALDLRLLPMHIDKVLKFTHLGPPVRDVTRLLKGRAFSAKLQAFDPVAQTDLLLPWLQRAAKQIVETPSRGAGGKLADRFFSTLRSRTGMQLMFANVSNTLQQVTGFSTVMLRVKPANIAAAFWRYVRAPGETAEAVASLSPYMATRTSAQMFEVRQTIEQLLLNPSKYDKLRDFATRHGYFLQTHAQNLVDTVGWAAAYDQAVARGDTEREAIRFADSVIRETQGTLSPEDVSRFETGTPFVRLFTQFYSFFNMNANLLGTEFQQVARGVGVKKGAGRLLYVYTLGFLVPALAADLIATAFRGGFDDEDEDGYLDELLQWFFLGQAKFAVAGVPIVGQAANATIGSFTGVPYDDKVSVSPAVSAIDSSVRVPAEVYQSIVEGESFNRRDVRDTLTFLGLMTGLPLGWVGRPIGYGVGVAQGDIEPTSTADAARGFLTGVPSPESRTTN